MARIYVRKLVPLPTHVQPWRCLAQAYSGWIHHKGRHVGLAQRILPRSLQDAITLRTGELFPIFLAKVAQVEISLGDLDEAQAANDRALS